MSHVTSISEVIFDIREISPAPSHPPPPKHIPHLQRLLLLSQISSSSPESQFLRLSRLPVDGLPRHFLVLGSPRRFGSPSTGRNQDLLCRVLEYIRNRTMKYVGNFSHPRRRHTSTGGHQDLLCRVLEYLRIQDD